MKTVRVLNLLEIVSDIYGTDTFGISFVCAEENPARDQDLMYNRT